MEEHEGDRQFGNNEQKWMTGWNEIEKHGREELHTQNIIIKFAFSISIFGRTE